MLIQFIKKNMVLVITVIPGMMIVFCFIPFSTAMAADTGGTLAISSLPSGTDVVCNGKPVGKTSLKLSGLKIHKPIKIEVFHQNTRLQAAIKYMQIGEYVQVHADFNKKTIRFGSTLADHLIFLMARIKKGEQKADQIISGLSSSRKAEVAEALAHSRLAEHIRKGASYAEKRNISRAIMKVKDSLGELSWNHVYTVKVIEHIYGNTSAACWLARRENGTYIEFENSYKTISPPFGKGDWIGAYIKTNNTSESECVFDVVWPEKHLRERYDITDCFHYSTVVKIKKIYQKHSKE